MLIYIYVGDVMAQVSFRVDDDIKKKAERTLYKVNLPQKWQTILQLYPYILSIFTTYR